MIIDIIAIAVLVLCIVFGFKKGFIKTIFSAASFLISIALVLLLLNPCVSFVSQTKVGESIKDHCYTFIDAKDTTQEDTGQSQSLIPENLLSGLNLTQANEAIENTKTELAKTVSEWIIKAICFVGLFIAVNLLLLIIKPLLNGIFKLPVLSFFNKLGGAAIGAINGGIILPVLSFVMLWLGTTDMAGQWCHTQLSQSQFASVIYYNNPLFSLFS